MNNASRENVQVMASAVMLLQRAMKPEDFARFRDIHTNDRFRPCRGETVATVVRSMTAQVEAALPKALRERVLDNDFTPDDWRRVFDAVDVAAAIDGA